ncbi:MAG: polyphosphate kinase 2 family protein [Gammaproteobacteria bacterium]
MNLKRYLCKPGANISLKNWNPDDKSAVPDSREQAEAELKALSDHLDHLQDLFYAEHDRKLLIVLQGMDTSGKDGTIRHVFQSVDPLGVRVVSFKAPTTEELDHDYLWRVHRQVPGKGEIVIFNRSHYEDVLIVRVHESITAKTCQQRYQQINDFERMLAETGTIIVKFFLYISKDEQKKRLEERLQDPDKRWKFRVGDLGERARWKDYMKAYEDALTATNTAWAPWHIVPANSKTNRNLLILAILIDVLESLKLRYPAPSEDLRDIVVE